MQVGQRFRKRIADLGRYTIFGVIWEGLCRILTREGGKPKGSFHSKLLENLGRNLRTLFECRYPPALCYAYLGGPPRLHPRDLPCNQSSVRSTDERDDTLILYL